MIAKIINTVFYTVCILLIIGLFIVFGSKTAKACDEDDLTVYCNYKTHKTCMSVGNSINCCKR